MAGHKLQISHAQARVSQYIGCARHCAHLQIVKLQETIALQERKCDSADKVITILKKKKRERFNQLNEENDALLSAIKEKSTLLTGTRLSGEHLLHEIEEMKQNIIEL